MAQLLDGRAVAKEIKEEIREQVEAWKQKGVEPKLAVVMAGGDPAAQVYARAKEKVAAGLGIGFELFALPEDVKEEEILATIDSLNRNEAVHGIMVELPLPAHLAKEKILTAIRPDKDVDGAHPINRGSIMAGTEGLFPATPQSCIELLLRYHISIGGKHVVIVGRGETVGKPLVFMILKHNATVTVCHSKTPDLAYFTRQADILIAAVGKANLITKEMVKHGIVVVDAGINEGENGICGDVDFAGVQDVAGYISPVPGGVGALTTALLMENVIKGIAMQKGAIE